MLGTEQPGLGKTHQKKLKVSSTITAGTEFHPDCLSAVTFNRHLFYPYIYLRSGNRNERFAGMFLLKVL